jgi:hypothetical protein
MLRISVVTATNTARHHLDFIGLSQGLKLSQQNHLSETPLFRLNKNPLTATTKWQRQNVREKGFEQSASKTAVVKETKKIGQYMRLSIYMSIFLRSFCCKENRYHLYLTIEINRIALTLSLAHHIWNGI